MNDNNATDPLIRPGPGTFICGICGNRELTINLATRNGETIAILRCPKCGNYVGFGNGNSDH